MLDKTCLCSRNHKALPFSRTVVSCEVVVVVVVVVSDLIALTSSFVHSTDTWTDWTGVVHIFPGRYDDENDDGDDDDDADDLDNYMCKFLKNPWRHTNFSSKHVSLLLPLYKLSSDYLSLPLKSFFLLSNCTTILGHYIFIPTPKW